MVFPLKNVSISSAHRATKFVHFKLYKFTVVQKLWELVCVVRVQICSYVCSKVDTSLPYVTQKPPRKYSTWLSDNPRIIHKMPLHDSKA